MSPPFALGTLCVHAARESDATTGAVAEPIHLSTTFERDADGGYPRGYRYIREGTPNRAALESCVAALEGGTAAVAFGSGLAASMAVWQLLGAGDRVVVPIEGYHGTLRQLHEYVRARGVEVRSADFRNTAAVAAALRDGARMVWIETPANPLLSITDLAAVSSLGRRAGAWIACDNTFATPVCQRPFDHAVDLVVHSATKYFGGHNDVMGGLVVIRDDAALLERIRQWQVLAGAVLAPFDCWLLRRSLATLALRLRAQCATALELALFLAAHPAVERVYYPGLPEHPGHAVAAAQMPGGFGAMLSFGVRGGREAALTVAARARLFRRATSLGGIESLIEHRASIEGPDSKTPQNLLRVSIGIEEPRDLIADLSLALA